jgi:hypothetical protein
VVLNQSHKGVGEEMAIVEYEAQNESRDVMTEMQSGRAAQEVQAAMIVAKRYPRDENAAIIRIRNACKRRKLAEMAVYTYPRGTTKVEGPSIRLAEAMAQSWGNLDFGVVELEQRKGESTCMAYCWDLETNTRQTKIFQVKHSRDTKRGAIALTDSRDVYELVANQGARRLRACILGVIPGDVVDEALEEVDRTLASNKDGKPLQDRVRAMAQAFDGLSISTAMIEARLSHKLDATSESELVGLRKIYTSIKDGMSKREDWFEVGSTTSKSVDDLVKPKNQASPMQVFTEKLASCGNVAEINALFKSTDMSKFSEEEIERINVLGLEREQELGAIQD